MMKERKIKQFLTYYLVFVGISYLLTFVLEGFLSKTQWIGPLVVGLIFAAGISFANRHKE
jgi:hypothetical protein